MGLWRRHNFTVQDVTSHTTLNDMTTISRISGINTSRTLTPIPSCKFIVLDLWHISFGSAKIKFVDVAHHTPLLI